MNWIHKADIKKYINDYAYRGLSFDKSRDGTVRLLRKYDFIPARFAAALARTTTEEGFDGVLERLYNWADANAVWLGL